MNRRILLVIIIVFTTVFSAEGQNKRDTIVISNTTYEKLKFKLGNSEMQYFEVIETDIDIRNGEIEKYEQSIDTIGIKNIDRNLKTETFEIQLSDNNWAKILFGRQCNYLSEQIDAYPTLKMSRNVATNKIAFLEPVKIGDFIMNNYEKRIDCIESSDDKFMKNYISDWIEMIKNDSINQFSTAYTSHLFHVFSLYDLITPTNPQDTIICKISNSNSDITTEFHYQTSTRINHDSSITIHFTDNVQESDPLTKQLLTSLYEPYANFLNNDERDINEIRLNSMKDIDKSDINLSKDGEFERYIRIMESFALDSNLKPKLSFYNFEIQKMPASNHER